MIEEREPKVLVADDELSVCKSCEKVLRREGHYVKTVLSGGEALDVLEGEEFDIVITDLKMARMGGMELLENLAARYPDIVTVVISGYATVASAVETMKLGAFDYLPKPFTPAELSAMISRAWDKRQLLLEKRKIEQGIASGRLENIIGKSEAMHSVFRKIKKVAPTSSTVLIVGESGTGKELVARAVHRNSGRKDDNFIAVDCGTLSVELLESELFGHVKGAFTGAGASTKGIFEAADGGTVFLDEICNVGLEIQGKLLRFIEEREFIPVGGTETKNVDVRLIFATNRDLSEMVEEGTFREDLYYRLHVYPIQLPPLKARKEDIPLLAHHLLKKVNDRTGGTFTDVSEAALKAMENYDWPGNVREMENVIERIVINYDDEIIEPGHFHDEITGPGSSDIPVPENNEELLALKKKLRKQVTAEVEKKFVLRALKRNDWNVSRAARDVGLRRQNFQSMMRKHDITSGNHK